MNSPESPKAASSLSRRQFIGTASSASLALAGFHIVTSRTRAAEPAIIGHGAFKYKVAEGWGELDPAQYPVANCHEMVEDSKGRLILFQTNVKNNVLIYDKSGKLLEAWGTEYPGAHGLDIVNENGEEFLFLTDTKLGKVFKTTLKGDVIMTLERPDASEYADAKTKYAPTNVMPAPDGTFYVGDGYGSSYVMHYSADGKLQSIFGGKGDAPENLDVPHGGLVDTRTPGKQELLICSRTDNAIKRMTMDGKHIETIPIPGMRVCQISIRGENLYAPHLEGLISVLDKDNKVVSNPGGSEPVYTDGKLGPITQADKTFVHPHGIWVDAEESVYVAQWNSGNTYPVKLERV